MNLPRIWAQLKTHWLTGRYSFEHRLKTFSNYSLKVSPASSVRWNDQAVPYIHGASDEDASYLLGAACQHLRSTQLLFIKKLAYGRLSEVGGRLFTELDYVIRMMDFSRSVQWQYANLDSDARIWLYHFVEGLNAVGQQQKRTMEDRLLGLRFEPWTVQDILTIGRMTGSDVNWSLYFSLLQHRHDQRYKLWWKKLLHAGSGLTPFAAQSSSIAENMLQWLTGHAKSGSNCMVVASSRSATGSPMLAADPHLGQQLPNSWMLVGIHSPRIQAVGFMFPAVPLIGFGRNHRVTWGGTNLRAASSDVVKLSARELSNLKIQTIKIRCRWWPTVKKVIRWSEFGPVISDSSLLPQKNEVENLALKWAGHEQTDEFTAFYKTMRADSCQSVFKAMGTAGVTPLNILCADVQHNISHMMAATLPTRKEILDDDVVISADQARDQWRTLQNCWSLPLNENPPQGFLLSANDKPHQPLIGFFFNGSGRIARMQSLLDRYQRLSVSDLKLIQTDVKAQDAVELAHGLAKELNTYSKDTLVVWLCRELSTWDGHYHANSQAALLFEKCLACLFPLTQCEKKQRSIPAFMTEWPFIKTHFLNDLIKMDAGNKPKLYTRLAHDVWKKNNQGHWGDFNRLELRHFLGAMPVIGKLFTLPGFAASGSRETLMKNSHGLMNKPSPTAYGSQARLIADLSSPDANYCVLLGGQDGKIGSQQFADQVDLWRQGKYIRMPLSQDLVEQEFVWTSRFQ